MLAGSARCELVFKHPHLRHLPFSHTRTLWEANLAASSLGVRVLGGARTMGMATEMVLNLRKTADKDNVVFLAQRLGRYLSAARVALEEQREAARHALVLLVTPSASTPSLSSNPSTV